MSKCVASTNSFQSMFKEMTMLYYKKKKKKDTQEIQSIDETAK